MIVVVVVAPGAGHAQIHGRSPDPVPAHAALPHVAGRGQNLAAAPLPGAERGQDLGLVVAEVRECPEG